MRYCVLFPIATVSAATMYQPRRAWRTHKVLSVSAKLFCLSFLVLLAACAGQPTVALPSSGAEGEANEAAPPSASPSDAADPGESDGPPASDDNPPPDSEALAEETRVGLMIADCEAGSDMACDVLIMNTDNNSPEEAVGVRCGGRRSKDVLFCTDGLEHRGRNYWFESDSPALPNVVQLCEAGDMTACDLLFYRSPEGSEYEAIGDGCAGRTDSAIPDCRTMFADEFSRCPTDLPTPCP